jgi:anti-sigma regulatory factor (Ser/Thr protein kinase)
METMVRLRPTVQRPRRFALAAGPAAAGEARGQVRAAIDDWDVPVDPEVAVLLTSELVTNAIQHQAGATITMTLTCVCDQLRVAGHDTSHRLPVHGQAPADAEAGRGLMLVASLSANWGFNRTGTGKVVYFTLMPPAALDESNGHRPNGHRTWVR